MTVYALLVGIDLYAPPIVPLRGCANDVRALSALLQARVDHALELRTLIDGEATRAAVIDAFRTHLGSAGPGDTALFCYSGHGSQEPAPERDWALEPDHLNETLVLADSREPHARDLADKELAGLIAGVAATGAHVAVVLDCCHSGSGTRDARFARTAVRRAPADMRPRAVETMIAEAAAVASPGSPSGWGMTGRHILMAACRDDEEAKEVESGESPRGAFSHFLGEVLADTGGGLSYRDLFDRAAARLRGRVRRQTPQLEASVAADLHRPFLGGAIRPPAPTFMVEQDDAGWRVDAGRVHGLFPANPTQPAEVAILPLGAAVETPPLARADIVEVRAATSRLRLRSGTLGAGPYTGLLTRQLRPRLQVRIEGDPAGAARARAVLAASPFLTEVKGVQPCGFRLIATGDSFLLARPEDDRPAVAPIPGSGPAEAAVAVERLAHIARWITTLALDNPASGIAADEVKLTIRRDGHALAGSDLRLTYDPDDLPPEIVVGVRNDGQRTLYVALLDLPQTFGVSSILSSVGCQKLEPGQETFAQGGAALSVTIPDELWAAGTSSFRDVLQLVVATAPFDARRLEQPDLDMPQSETRAAARGPNGTLEALMDAVQTRHIGATPARIDDWRTVSVALDIVRSMPRLAASRGVVLCNGARLEAHPALDGTTVRLAAGGWTAAVPLPRLLYEDPAIAGAFPLAPSPAGADVLNALLLTNVTKRALVTAEAPLVLYLPRPLDPEEQVVPLAVVDGFILPLGWAEGRRILIERLPEGATALFFYRIAMPSPSPAIAIWMTTALAIGLNELGRGPWPVSFLPDLARTVAGLVPPGFTQPAFGEVAAATDLRRAAQRRLITLLWPDEAGRAYVLACDFSWIGINSPQSMLHSSRSVDGATP